VFAVSFLFGLFNDAKPSRPVLGPSQSPIQSVPGFFPIGKEGGAWGLPLISIYRQG